MKSLLLLPAVALIAAPPDVERLDSSTIQIVGVDPNNGLGYFGLIEALQRSQPGGG